jgi:hypothetical protein
MMPLSGLIIEVAACTVMSLSIACLITSHVFGSHGSSASARWPPPLARWQPALRHGKMLVAIEEVFFCAGAPQQAYRRHMPGKWMSLSGLTIEVATRAVHLVQIVTFFPSSGYIELEGKGFRTGCSSQVPVNRGSLLVLSGRQWGTFSCCEISERCECRLCQCSLPVRGRSSLDA